MDVLTTPFARKVLPRFGAWFYRILEQEKPLANMGETTPARELVYNEGGERTQHVSPRTDTV
jgi:hypothetical protein